MGVNTENISTQRSNLTFSDYTTRIQPTHSSGKLRQNAALLLREEIFTVIQEVTGFIFLAAAGVFSEQTEDQPP